MACHVTSYVSFMEAGWGLTSLRSVEAKTELTSLRSVEAHTFLELTSLQSVEAHTIYELISLWSMEALLRLWERTSAVSLFNACYKRVYVAVQVGKETKGWIPVRLLTSGCLCEVLRLEHAYVSREFPSLGGKGGSGAQA